MTINDGQFFTWAQLRTYIGEQQSLRAFDEENSGQELDDSVNLLIEEADQAIIASAVKNYPSEVASTVTPATAHPRLKMLALRYARALIQVNMPGVFPLNDKYEEMKMAEKSLLDLATGKTHLRDAEQSNARAVVRNGIAVGASTKRTFGSFGSY